jgi:hypothetical protein
MEFETAAAERGRRTETWLGGLLVRGLSLPEGLTVEQAAREREGARAAAEALAEELGGEGGDESGLEAQVLAAQFVSAHAAAMDCQAEANRRDLPPHARATSQRLARQLMALTTSQVHALCRLRAERRKDREQAARLAREQTAAKAAAESRAWIADRRALVTDLERGLKAAAGASAADLAAEDLDRADDPDLPSPKRSSGFAQAGAMAEPDPDALTDLALAMAAPLPGSEPPGAAPPAPPRPEPVGAGVPEPPAEPQPPLNRRQRRALARLRRKRVRADPQASGTA